MSKEMFITTNLRKGGMSDNEKLAELLFFTTSEGIYTVSELWGRVKPLAEMLQIEDAEHKFRSVLHTYCNKIGGTHYNKIERLMYATYKLSYRTEYFVS